MMFNHKSKNVAFFFGCALVTGLLLIEWPLYANLEKMETNQMRSISGQKGIAFRLTDWQIDGGDATLQIHDDDYEELSIGRFRVMDPTGSIDAPNPADDTHGPCEENGPCDSNDGGLMVSGTWNDPFTLDVSDAGSEEGRVALTFPDSRESFEAAHIQMALAMDGNNLGTLTIGNALWAGGTQFAMSVRESGGIDLGIELVLDGDVWFSTKIPQDYDNDGFTINGIYGAGDYDSWRSGCDDLSSSNYSSNGFDGGCFSGELAWADLDAGRPLELDFGPGSSSPDIRLRRDSAPSGGQGAIGIEQFDWDYGTNKGSFDMGATLIEEVNIEFFNLTGPT